MLCPNDPRPQFSISLSFHPGWCPCFYLCNWVEANSKTNTGRKPQIEWHHKRWKRAAPEPRPQQGGLFVRSQWHGGHGGIAVQRRRRAARQLANCVRWTQGWRRRFLSIIVKQAYLPEARSVHKAHALQEFIKRSRTIGCWRDVRICWNWWAV